MFGDTFNNQRQEQFPSRLRQIDQTSPKFVAKLKQTLHTTQGPNTNGAPFQSKQYIIFPKIQQTIRQQELENRNNAFLSLASSHISLAQLSSSTVSSDTLKLVYSQPYLHYQNVKKIRKISPEWLDQHVCKKSMTIPHHQGNYAMPGLPHSESRTGKLMNMSFTKMQLDYNNYNSNFALSKREKEIRTFLKIARLAPQVQMQKQQQSQQQQQEQTDDSQLNQQSSLMEEGQTRITGNQFTSQQNQRRQKPQFQMLSTGSSSSLRDNNLAIKTGRTAATAAAISTQEKSSTPSQIQAGFSKTQNANFEFLTAYSKSPSQASNITIKTNNNNNNNSSNNLMGSKEQITQNNPISPPKIQLF